MKAALTALLWNAFVNKQGCILYLLTQLKFSLKVEQNRVFFILRIHLKRINICKQNVLWEHGAASMSHASVCFVLLLVWFLVLTPLLSHWIITLMCINPLISGIIIYLHLFLHLFTESCLYPGTHVYSCLYIHTSYPFFVFQLIFCYIGLLFGRSWNINPITAKLPLLDQDT